MPPTALPALFCSPNDIFDYLSSAGAQLRLDDDNLANGQTILVAVDAAIGDTTLQVAPLQFPLLKGSQLSFEGGGMEALLTVALAATAQAGDTSLTVAVLTAPVYATAVATDNGVNVATGQRLVKACNYGTDRVRLYCFPRYDDLALATSYNVNRWASTLGGAWLAKRCCRPCPESIKADMEEITEELKQVKSGYMAVPGIGTRTAAWPFISNHSVVVGPWTHQNRIETSISEGTPTLYGQIVDWSDAMLIQF